MNGIIRSSLLILRGLFRNPRHWGGVAAIMLLVTALTSLFMVTSATRLTPSQLTEAYIGDATYQATSPGDRCAPSDCPVGPQMTQALESMGATNVGLEIATSGASLGGSDGPRVDITEAAWSDSHHPEAYRLLEGRWPAGANELAITNDSELDLEIGSSTQFYGHTSATVVGVVQVVYVPSPTSLLSGPGLVDRIYDDLQQYGNRYAGPDVQTNIRWDGPNLSEALPELATVIAESQSFSEDIALSSLEQSATERDDSPRPQWDWFRVTPSLWGVLPVGVISLMAGVLAVLSNRSFSHRVAGQLLSIGIGDAVSTAIVTMFRTVLLAAASLTGVTLGWLLTLAVRSQLERSVGHALSPVFIPWFFLLVVLAVAVTIPGLTAVARLLTPYGLRALTWFTAPTARLLYSVLVVAAVGGVAVWTMMGIQQVGDSYNNMTQFVVALGTVGAFVIAVTLAWALRLEPKHLNTALPIRRMRGNRMVSVLVALLSAVAVVIPLSLGVSLTTTSFYGAQKSVGLVPEGSVELGMSAATVGGVPPELPGQVADYAGLPQPALVRQSSINTTEGDGSAYVVDSQSEVEQLLGRRLTAKEADIWSQGGLLTGSDLYGGQDHLTVETYTNPETVERFEVPVTPLASAPVEYTQQVLGFIPLSTARDHDASMLPAYYVFAGVSQDQSDAAAYSPEALNFDPWWLHVHEAPEAAAPSPSVSILAGALAATLLLVVIALARTVSQQLRPYGASLSALGIGPGVLATTLTITLGYLVVLPLLLGSAAAIGANALGWSMLADGYAIVIPWRWVLTYSAIIFLVIFMAVAVFGLSISKVQRRDVE